MTESEERIPHRDDLAEPPTGEDEDLGEGTGRQGPWAEDDEGPRAAKQQGDTHALDVEGDPRGGLQSDEYRHADPRVVVVEEGSVPMAGPAGAPQEGLSVEERKELSRKLGHDPRFPAPETEG